MDSRQRLIKSLNHQQPDKLVCDFGGTYLTGIHVSTVYKLRQYLGLDSQGTPVKVIEPYQMLGEIKEDLMFKLFSDVKMPQSLKDNFGIPNEDFKDWVLDDGTPVLVPNLFNTEKNSDGSVYQYPGGNKDLGPTAVMPKSGYYFDAIIRKKGFDEKNPDPMQNIEEYKVLKDEEIKNLYSSIKNIWDNTGFAIAMPLFGTSFGDIFTIPGISLADPKGIRDIEEWYISLHTRKQYIKKMFSAQLEIAIENLKKLSVDILKLVNVAVVSGTDFGTQSGLFISPDTYRELFKPYYKKINDFIHENTSCKTFIHSCGSVVGLISEFIDSGFDILNPVQISASEMKPERLKSEFGKDITFWGGGIDTQKTLPLANPKEVTEQAKKLIDIFSKDGGFVFAAVHNIQANVPVENIIALTDAIRQFR